MNIFLDTNQELPYFLKSDTDKEIEWSFRPIDVLSMFAIRAGKEDYLQLMVGFLRHGLKSAKGIEIPMEEVDIPMLGKKNIVAMDFVTKLRPEIFSELATHSYEINTLTGQQEKN